MPRMVSVRPLRICIVTTANVSDNPRVVKEADALAAAGHDVRVVAHRTSDAKAHSDAQLMQGRAWRLEEVAVTPPMLSRVRWGLATLRQRSARVVAASVPVPAIGRDLAISKHIYRLAAAAARSPADIVIAHHVPALPAAARAARKFGAALVYDFEDYYSGGPADDRAGRHERELILAIERKYIPLARLVTASADGVADLVARDYRVTTPTVIPNTFPLAAADRPTATVDRRAKDRVSCYWFSQVIGPERGLEAGLRGIAAAGVPVEIHLRGMLSDGFEATLRRELSGNDAVSLHLHPPAPAGELVAISAQHDIGLALESTLTDYRRHSISNKLLTYFPAANAILASDTPAQIAVLRDAPGCGSVVNTSDAHAVGAVVREYVASPGRLAAARAASRAAAERRYCWELDAPRLVAAIESVA